MNRCLYHFAIIIILHLIVPIFFVPNVMASNNFFNDEKRGWLWFEEKQEEDDKGESKEHTRSELEQAKLENEQFKEELELLRHMMIRYPENTQYIKAYKEKEKIMLDNAMVLAKNYAMTNFLYPHLADNLKNPQNMYGRKLQEEERNIENKQILRNLASKIELFVFIQEDCIYCDTLQKHLNTFRKRYGFKVEAITNDNSKSKYFTTNNSQELVDALDLEVMPTVIAVTNDSKYRFEIARGAVSISDLSERVLLIDRYLKELSEGSEND